jgi:glutathione synthase/RimK-type ligase-like ATP-grasp enzyme
MLRKIGILYGRENSFPPALIERINSKKEPNIVAEPVFIDKLHQGDLSGYAVIIDRISQDVPFYRAYLKNAALTGTAVINNPFWWSADEKFFNNCLCEVSGVKVPKTALLPSHERPTDTEPTSFRNLALPLDFKAIFDYVGFPAFFKPFAGGGWKNVYKVHSAEELFHVWSQTGQLVMMLQESIEYEEYYRCYCLDRKDVLVMRYEPKNYFHERYVRDAQIDPATHEKLVDLVLKINNALGYDFNTVEIAIRDGVMYPIDFCNPAPDADNFSVGEKNFEWVVEHAAQMAIRRAKEYKPGKQNLTWGDFIKKSVAGKAI